MDKTGELTGDDIAYIYPDMRMALKVRTQKNLTHNIRQACSPLIQLFFGFASDIDQTNKNRDIRDGNWLSRGAV